MIEHKTEEQYTLINLKSDVLDEQLMQKANTLVAEAMEAGATNFILNLSAINSIAPGTYHLFDTMQQIVTKENGILVVCEAGHEAEEKLKELEITTTPTLDEATDYIFMEELERQLLNGDEEGEELDLE